MMQTFNSKYPAPAAPETRRGQRPASRPGVIPCLTASLLLAVPLPAFAENGGQPFASDSVPNPDVFSQFSSDGQATLDHAAVTNGSGTDANAIQARFLPREAPTAAASENGRYSVHNRMKVK